MRRWEIILGSEAKSRLYLILLGNAEGLNVFKVARKFEEEGKKEYSRPFVETALKEMAKEGILATELIEQEGKRPIQVYRADPHVYLEFLKDVAGIADEKELDEAKKIVLGFSPLLNEFAVQETPKRVDAINDISMICSVGGEWWSYPTEGSSDEDDIRKFRQVVGAGFRGPPKAMIDLLKFALPTLDKQVRVIRACATRENKPDDTIIKSAEKYSGIFWAANGAAGFVLGVKDRDKSWSFDDIQKTYSAMLKKYTRRRT
jgi:hypothetical protein